MENPMQWCGSGDTFSVPYLLVILFGLSSWALVNAVYSQLPLFVETLPEGRSIGVYITVAFQAANIFPLLHYLISRFLVPRGKKFIADTVSVYILIVAGNENF